jgi:glycosyltransferase involved in cell wall biosynthesis
VLIPSYNAGPNLRRTVQGALSVWAPVWVVDDGSTDGSADAVAGAVVLGRARNGGKGAAVFDGLVQAAAQGFTHVLVMDGDGQHPASSIAAFMAASIAQPEAMVLGLPRFGPDAPAVRLAGRRIANLCARLATGDPAIGDCLFGFRVYPIAPLLEVMRQTRWMRGFDFDPEAAIRLVRMGVPTINLAAPVRYPPRAEGGVSHFRYGRDNLLLTWMFLRLALTPWRRPRV